MHWDIRLHLRRLRLVKVEELLESQDEGDNGKLQELDYLKSFFQKKFRKSTHHFIRDLTKASIIEMKN